MTSFDSRFRAVGILLVTAVFAWIAISTAWLCDDSFISFRQVFNAINGYGYTFNFEQRVQAFTHPSWALLLTLVALLTRELYMTTLVLSIALSLASVLFLFRHSWHLPGARPKNLWFALFFVLGLAFSKSFTDYMTSGLENPLSYFLVGCILILAAKSNRDELGRGGQVLLFVFLALALLNRFDYAVLLLPLALYLAFSKIGLPVILRVALPGTLLIVGWLVFATTYFGAPLPNTFYAKHGTGFPSSEVYERGWQYISVSFENDPLTLALILVGTLAGLVTRNGVYRALSVGTVLYVLLILGFGGDFMLGRFFAILAYLSIFNLCALVAYVRPLLSVVNAAVIACVIGVFIDTAPLWSGPDHSNRELTGGLVEERGWYYQMYGLLAPNRRWPEMKPPVSESPQSYRVTCGGMGIGGLQSPDVYLIDRCGLTDAFIARLPAIQNEDWRQRIEKGKWMVGHPYRKVPTNYGFYLTGEGTLEDEKLRSMLDDVEEAIRGTLFTKARWQAIWRLNITQPYDFDVRTYTDPEITVNLSNQVLELNLLELNHREKVLDGTRWNSPGNTLFEHQLIAYSESDSLIKGIHLSLDSNDRYEITVNDADKFVVKESSHQVANGGLVSHNIEFDQPMVVQSVKIRAVSGDSFYALGHLIMVEN